MTKNRFEKILERNKNDNFGLCYEYYIEERGSKPKISRNTFDDMFGMWLAITNQSLPQKIEELKKRYL